MANAKLILDSKTVLQDGRILQRTVWLLPANQAERLHRFKYRLHCGRTGQTIVRYDNETGKGDHRHTGANEVESAYGFTTLVQLLKDFVQDVERLSGEIK